jgi:hypothetical protein
VYLDEDALEASVIRIYRFCLLFLVFIAAFHGLDQVVGFWMGYTIAIIGAVCGAFSD